MRDFRKLDVWVKAHGFVLDVYRATRAFRNEEKYGLVSQLRRAAASVPANVAEGCGRDGAAELARFLRIAAGSASEAEYHLPLAHDLGMLSDRDYAELTNRVTEIKRMLTGLTRKITTDR